MKHKLKIKSKYAERIISGEKNFEIRQNDRDYQTGDSVILYVLQEPGETLPCKFITATINYIHQDGFGMDAGYVVLGLKNIGYEEEPK